MKKTKFQTPLQFAFRIINHAAVLEKFGYFVEQVRQPGSRRVIFYADDLPAVHDLLEAFDRGEPLQCSTKELLDIRADICRRAKALAMGVGL